MHFFVCLNLKQMRRSMQFILPGAVSYRLICLSVISLLLATATAKIISISQNAKVLDLADPMFRFLSIRLVLLFAVVLELFVAATLLLKPRARASLWVLWLCLIFLWYRISLMVLGYEQPCKCLGQTLDWLGFNEAVSDGVSKIILGYLFCAGAWSEEMPSNPHLWN
jgi:hypothetical protein